MPVATVISNGHHFALTESAASVGEHHSESMES